MLFGSQPRNLGLSYWMLLGFALPDRAGQLGHNEFPRVVWVDSIFRFDLPQEFNFASASIVPASGSLINLVDGKNAERPDCERRGV